MIGFFLSRNSKVNDHRNHVSACNESHNPFATVMPASSLFYPDGSYFSSIPDIRQRLRTQPFAQLGQIKAGRGHGGFR